MTKSRIAKVIRLKGLAAFVIVVSLISLVWIFAADGIVKRIIEKSGTGIIGASVELTSADLRLFPPGVRLTGLQVTDPEHPMKNAVEVKSILFDLDGANLLRRKVIIDDMEVTGISFNTERRRSGAVTKKRRVPKTEATDAKSRAGGLGADLLKLPDPKELMAGIKLSSLTAIEELKADISKSEQEWKRRLKELPGKKEFDDYKDRFERLKSKSGGSGLGALLGGAAGFVELQQDIKKDLDKIKEAQKGIEDITKEFESKIKAATEGPDRELKKIMSRYVPSSGNLSDISSMLLNDRAERLVSTALKWHARLTPIAERVRENQKSEDVEIVRHVRGSGVTVRFKESSPTPDFLIRRLNFSVESGLGGFAGSAVNITPDAELLGAPMKITVKAAETGLAEKIIIDATIDRTSPAAPADSLRASVTGAKVKSLTLSDSKDMPISIDKAEAGLKLTARLKGDALKASADITLKKLVLKTGSGERDGQEEKSRLQDAIASALSSIKELKIGLEVKGTLEDYTVRITSGLDSILKGVIEGTLKAQIAALEKGLKKEIAAKTAGPLKGLGATLSPLQDLNKTLTERLGLGADLLKTPASSSKTEEGKSGSPIPTLPFKLPF